MTRHPPSDSRELGLELGLLALHSFAGTDELHYGYWDDDLVVSLDNIAKAQARYTERLAACVPASAERILDVGCGAGVVAEQLVARGHAVECVSPSDVLADRAGARLGNRVPMHRCRFQDLAVEPRFDLVLFSESFQYIPMATALQRARAMLRPGGRILVCDFFRTAVAGRGPMGGGHPYAALHPALDAQGLCIRREEDWTDRVAPTLAVYERLRQELIGPAAEVLYGYARSRHPWVSALAARLMRRKLERCQRKYLSGERNPDAFRHWKTYRLLELVPTADAPEPVHPAVNRAPPGEGLKAWAKTVALPLGLCVA